MPPDPIALGSRIADRYELVELLDERRGVSVYRAHQQGLMREVVVKVLPRGDEPRAELRFNREASALAKLNHPACVDVFDYGVWKGHLFLATGYIEGEVLADTMERRWTTGAALELAFSIAKGMAHAHARGVVHRDISPHRIVVTEVHGGLPQGHLVDFAVARFEEAAYHTTAGRAPVGTPGYMAPERLQGDAGEESADVYALGVLLYELIVGTHPFKRARAIETLAAQATGHLPSLADAQPAVETTAALTWAIQRATEPDPGRRIRDGENLVRALRAARASMLDPSLEGIIPSIDDGVVTLPEALQVPDEEVSIRSRAALKPANSSSPVGRTLGIIAAVVVVLLLVGFAATCAIAGIVIAIS